MRLMEYCLGDSLCVFCVDDRFCHECWNHPSYNYEDRHLRYDNDEFWCKERAIRKKDTSKACDRFQCTMYKRPPPYMKSDLIWWLTHPFTICL